MNRSPKALRQTPLHAAHGQLGARMVDFGGWDMPLQYAGIHAEHRAVRQGAGLFDVCHMGQIRVRGAGAEAFLQFLLPRDIARMRDRRMLYAPMCAEDGGTIDDLLVYRLGGDDYLLVVNASRTAEDMAWIAAKAEAYDKVQVADESPRWGMIALQGPQAPAVAEQLLGKAPALRYYAFTALQDGTLISRSGYTGERGYEILCPTAKTLDWWKRCLALGVQPAGLGARDILRTEMGFALYGHELTRDISPLQAGLEWALDFGKEADFCGRSALERQRQDPALERLAGLVLQEKGIPRPQYSVCDLAGKVLGRVTSGAYSPALERGIALALVGGPAPEPGSPLSIDMRGRQRAAKLVRPPFVPSRVR